MNYGSAMNQVKAVGQSLVKVCGRVVTSTSGTISSQDVRGGSCVITKTGSKTGRYTFTMQAGQDFAITDLVFISLLVNIIGPDDAAITNSKGIIPFVRDIDIGEGADDGTVEVQFVISTATGQADTELADAAGFCFELTLGNKKVG
jgi:hypothetical protein